MALLALGRDKNYKIPLPVRPPKFTEKLQKNYKNCIFGVILPLFWGNFPHFRGWDRGGEFCNFSLFFGDFRPGGFPGPVRGKTTRNSSTKRVLSLGKMRDLIPCDQRIAGDR